MGEWKQVGNKLVYMFGELSGWTPGADVISSIPGIYNCKNVRFSKGRIETRGGWSTITTGATALKGIHGFIDGDGSHIVLADNYAIYELQEGSWVSVFSTIGQIAFIKPDFVTVPSSDGTASIIVVDGRNLNHRMDLSDKPYEVGSIKIASFDEEWAETAGEVDAEYSVFNSGTRSLKLTAQDAETSTGTLTLGTSGSWTKANPDKYDNDCILGDNSATEYQVATKIAVDGIFDTVEFYYDPVNTPDAASLFVSVEDRKSVV